MKKHFLLIVFLLFTFCLFSQTNVRAWYAQGQVWVVWETPVPGPDTYGIYKKITAFNNTNQANLIGRPFQFEYLPGTYYQQTGDPNFTYRIPKPDGTVYQLAPGEGLFVETVLNAGSAFYAVVAWGQTAVTAGGNITQSAVNYTFNPITQPINCHLQRTEILPTGHKTAWFSMWALGRQDENAGRPDFPVMANAAKNGMPSMFIISQSLTLDTMGGQKVPMTHLFHGGGGVAQQMIANRFKQFNLEPKQGISVAHNDDFPVNTVGETGDSIFTSGRSLWFGWTKRHNPFDFGFAAMPGDTVINYTQRRIVWINDWLIKHLPIDPNRVALMGYSMGTGGATVLAKSFPDKFSTACMFNTGFRGAEDATSVRVVGSMSDNLPTNLRGWNNQTVRIEEAFSLNVPCSEQRDFPIMRVWVGKNDDNSRMHWGPAVAAQFRRADSLGWGTQFHWDERGHTYPTLNFHWIQGEGGGEQTYRDNMSYQEFFRSNQSYPGFFNHRLEPLNNDPGTGQLGINNGDGDNWGTWGGWHNWDLGSITDEPGKWEVTAWLTANAPFANDNCPENALLTDLFIRKPQQFNPAPGKMLEWRVRDIANNLVIQAGQTTVRPDGLVLVPQIFVTKETFRKILIQVYDPTVATQESEEDMFALAIYPNPTSGMLYFKNEFETARVLDLNGKILLEKYVPGSMQLDVSSLANGLYFLEISENKARLKISRFVKN
ncbi:MAG: T9SS type A sorting domain-containing protein [Phycisphaerae bacterium]|nr:T9SS type A sorting domain-containing protein [Saprospiraceae bacterium]